MTKPVHIYIGEGFLLCFPNARAKTGTRAVC